MTRALEAGSRMTSVSTCFHQAIHWPGLSLAVLHAQQTQNSRHISSSCDPQVVLDCPWHTCAVANARSLTSTLLLLQPWGSTVQHFRGF